MTEKLEEKYKYMCKLVEQMASSLHKADKIIEENERLKDHIFGMCEMIHYQVPLNEQDDWMETMREQGLWKPEVENETK